MMWHLQQNKRAGEGNWYTVLITIFCPVQVCFHTVHDRPTYIWCDFVYVWKRLRDKVLKEKHENKTHSSIKGGQRSSTWTGPAARSWARRQEYWTVPGTAWVCSICPPLPQTPASCPEPAAASAACRWAGTCPPPHIWCCTAAADCCRGAESPEASGWPEREQIQAWRPNQTEQHGTHKIINVWLLSLRWRNWCRWPYRVVKQQLL